MIQRIQSVWLLLSALASLAMFFVNVYSVNLPADMPAEVIADYSLIINIKNNFLALGLAGLSTILSLVTIFMFKNRKQQVNFTWLNILVNIGLLFWLYLGLNKFWNLYPTNGGHIWIGLFLPAITVFLLILALRGIRKDNKLIKSLDRLR